MPSAIQRENLRKVTNNTTAGKEKPKHGSYS